MNTNRLLASKHSMSDDDTAPTPAAKRLRPDYTAYITVLVGPEKKAYIVHENTIVHHSAFFRAACLGRFKESKERLVRLPEASCDIFEILIHWTYTKEILIQGIGFAADRQGIRRYRRLAATWVLADQLEVRELRNATIDSILKLQKEIKVKPSFGAMTIAYQQTTEHSTLRALIRDSYTRGFPSKWLKTISREKFPLEFLFDCAVSAGTGFTKPPSPGISSKCRYHEHEEGEPKCN
ncbi:uncharacterized protein RCC_07497 [Ramularia collo-cygni]|uniref:BTB domain-containing protein n=1 Tax=Ramularia collo-cygni TaxID=112498 RepID=A0A2D3UVA4_9PEZI|nr:uncharacterized protein RCC_07497 [Ramularia collo-cygni]CZT21632.1 uncharacterized protein RCC_07497 [Ramularia collo-cygni]